MVGGAGAAGAALNFSQQMGPVGCHRENSSGGHSWKPTSSCVRFVEAVLKTGFPFLDWLWSWEKRFQKKKMQWDCFRGAGSQSLWRWKRENDY